MPSPATNSGFFYVAAKPAGGRSMGVRSAKSERALAQGLRRERLILTKAWKLPAALTTERPMSMKDIAAMNEQLSQLLVRGVPLVEAIQVAQTVVSKVSQPRLEQIRESVGAGGSFADACSATGAFDEVMVAVYRAAERAGNLAESCREVSEAIRRQMAIQGKAVTLLIYPAVVMAISVVVGLGMLLFVVPNSLSSIKDVGAELPWFSEALLWTGVNLRANLLPAAAVVAALLVGAILLRKPAVAAFGKFARTLPLVGPMLLAHESARFFAVMGAMTRSGIPLADALGVATASVQHPNLRVQLNRLREKLIAGGVFGRLVNDVDALPEATRKLLIAAERSGDLETAFAQLRDDMIDLVERRTARLLAVMEPGLIVVMFLFIGVMVMAVMYPMITATTTIGF
ncbi:MAG: type II secretion system F family protein [Planctomycetota bacterium]